MTIGFIGNFIPPFSTENERKWSLEKLGHTVIPFQENKTAISEIGRYFNTLDLLIYSHTHGWRIPGLKGLFSECKTNGIPTCSIHLDRWAWLSRQKDMGEEATWFTEYIFMADGSPEAVKLYERLKLNWYYLPAGVVERETYMAAPDYSKYPHPIVFTGSSSYHPEYMFRKQMVDFLTNTYGNQFGHYGNDGIRVVRKSELNSLYASAKIVVGDSCFGGRPRYVSDRYYEVRGRGGFLIHPKTEGIDNVGVGHYDRGDLNSLKETIDYFLSRPSEIENMRLKGFNEVKANHTYTNRAKQMMEVIND